MKLKISKPVYIGYLFVGVTLIVLVILSSYIYFLRGLYTEEFERDFFNDLYDHSQYNIAQSFRGINDASVYQVVGDRLVRGISGVFSVDPQVPPLGKIIIGISVNSFGNAYLQNIIIFVLLLIGVFLLGWQMLDSHAKRAVFVLLVMLDPIIVSQLKTTMLDLMSLLIIVWFCNIFIFSQVKKKKVFMVILGGFLSGLLLGILASIKFGLIVPILIFATILWKLTPAKFSSIKDLVGGLKFNLKAAKYLLIILVMGAVAGFVLGHLSYFFEYNSSIVNFLKNEKWVINYWLAGSNTSQNSFVILISIFTGLYKHFTSGSNWEWISNDWNPLWSIGMIGWGILVIKYVRNKLYVRKEVIFVFFVILLIIAAYSVMPFYFRYITHISPFILLGIMLLPFEKIGMTKNKTMLLVVIIFSSLYFKNIFLLFEQPNGIINDYERLTRQKLYKDVYEKLQPETKTSINFSNFWDTLYTAEYGLGKHKISLDRLENPKIIMPWENRVSVPYRKIYSTELGDIVVNYYLELVRIGHNWKIIWRDKYVYPDYTFGDKFVIDLDAHVKYGALIDKTGAVKLRRQSHPYAIIYPDRIRNEADVIAFFEKNMGLSQFRLEEMYKVNFPSHLGAKIGHFPDLYSNANDIPNGVSVVSIDRWVGDFENVNPDELGVQGGKIYLLKKNGLKKIILEKKSIQGRDIYL